MFYLNRLTSNSGIEDFSYFPRSHLAFQSGCHGDVTLSDVPICLALLESVWCLQPEEDCKYHTL